jgi:hypothetical protein
MTGTFILRFWEDEADMKDQKNEKKYKHSLFHLVTILLKINLFCQFQSQLPYSFSNLARVYHPQA